MQNDSPKKILLVDDEPDILEFLRYNLKKEGYLVYSAPDGKKALQLAQEHQPDIILLDIMMPVMDGLETCRMLRKMPSFKHTPIAFLTANDEDLMQIQALDEGGDDYITKPIKPKVLLSRIQALLRRAGLREEWENEDLVKIADLEIDKAQYSVEKNGESLELPKKEFELLWLLASRPGRVFTRDEIFNHIWEPDVIVGSRTIDVHIRKLREKIGEDYIKTIKGVGYKFDF